MLNRIFFFLTAILALTACIREERIRSNNIQVPETYEFTRDGASTVSFGGQDDRLDQVEAIKAYLKNGDGGARIDAAVLLAAYSNEGGNGNGFFDFTSTKQLQDKTFTPDLDAEFMENLFASAEAASSGGNTASNGQAGLIIRENSGNTILVDENGREFTQLIEKGLMGTVMYHQIYNTYLTDVRIGDNVENEELVEDKNYTKLEHHWDEAYGYFNAPVDFESNWPSNRGAEDRFWSHYSNVVDPHTGSNTKIMDAFKIGRTAIVNDNHFEKNIQRDVLYTELDLVAAATCIHYINETLAHINSGFQGEALHTLSEAWAFANALRYNPNRRLTLAQIETIMETNFGENGNFWNVTTAGLNTAKNSIVSKYPSLSSVKDRL